MILDWSAVVHRLDWDTALGEGEMTDGNRQAGNQTDLAGALHKIAARFASRTRWPVAANLASAATIAGLR